MRIIATLKWLWRQVTARPTLLALPKPCPCCLPSYRKGHEDGRKLANRTARKEGYDIAIALSQQEMNEAHERAALHQEELIDLALMMAVTA